MAAQTLIPAQTGAVTTPKFIELTASNIPATITAMGLAGVEAVPLLISVDEGVTPEAIFQDDSAVELTATNNVKTITSPCRIGVTKPATAGAAGVFISYDDQA